MEGKKKYYKYVKYIFLILGMSIQVVSYNKGEFNFFVCGILFVLVHNFLFFCEDYSKRALYFVFNITFFTFLLSRPLIGMIRGEIWWRSVTDKDAYVWFALWLISVGLYAIDFGGYIAVYIHEKNQSKKIYNLKKKYLRESDFQVHLQVVSMIIFYMTLPLFFIQEMEPLVYSFGKGYLSYYSEFQSQLPGFFHTLASFMKISLCVFLSTFPTKKRAFIPLAFYEISAVPALLIGIRNPIMLNSLFILVYYLLRDGVENYKKWFGKIEKLVVGIATPFVLMFMAAYAYIRGGNFTGDMNPFKYFIEFFYSQGVTFDVIQMAYGYVESLRLRVSNYTFGGIIDYIYYGTIGQKLWGTVAFPSGNCIEKAVYSHNLSHHLSYISLKESYLQGRGWGSSYLLENYVDYGYIGVLILGIGLGVLLVSAAYCFGKNTFFTTIVLMVLTTIFLIPRAEATGWLTFIITVQFWVCIGGCYLGGVILKKCEFLQVILKKMKLYPKS